MDNKTIIMTFIAESEYDAERVPLLLEAIGVKEFIKHINSEQEGEKHSIFTIKTDIKVKVFSVMMRYLINKDARFLGMARCYETLSEGFKPNECSYADEPSHNSNMVMLFSK